MKSQQKKVENGLIRKQICLMMFKQPHRSLVLKTKTRVLPIDTEDGQFPDGGVNVLSTVTRGISGCLPSKQHAVCISGTDLLRQLHVLPH